MRFTQIKETCIYVTDLVRTQQFYQQKLGFELISLVEGRHVFFKVGSSVLLCFLPEITRNEKALPPHYAEGPMHLAFEVPFNDYETIKQEVISAGIEIIHEQSWQNGMYHSFYFHDMDNHVLEIVPEGMWD